MPRYRNEKYLVLKSEDINRYLSVAERVTVAALTAKVEQARVKDKLRIHKYAVTSDIDACYPIVTMLLETFSTFGSEGDTNNA